MTKESGRFASGKFRLTVTLEGLITIVQRRTSQHGLYACMPYDGHHDHHVGIAYKKGAAAPIVVSEDFKGGLDWRDSQIVSGHGPKISGLLPLSSFVGQAVDKSYLEGPVPDAAPTTIIARIVLPLPKRKPRVGDMVEAAWEVSKAKRLPIGPVTGRLTIVYDVKNDVTLDQIGDVTEDTHILVRHLPPPGAPKSRKKWDRLEHSHIHMGLFGGATENFVIAEDYDDADHTYPVVSPQVSGFGPAMIGVNPVMCTLGGGCPPEEHPCDDT